MQALKLEGSSFIFSHSQLIASDEVTLIFVHVYRRLGKRLFTVSCVISEPKLVARQLVARQLVVATLMKRCWF